MISLEDKIIEIVGLESYKLGKMIPIDNVLSQRVLTIFGNDKIFKYMIQELNQKAIYHVELILKNRELISLNCNCGKDKCEHIAAVLIKHQDELFPDLVYNNNKVTNDLNISQKIINQLYSEKNIEKKILTLEIDLKFISSLYSKTGLLVSLKVGQQKLYSLNNKLYSFFNAYYNHQNIVFSKYFEYDPTIHYFNDEDHKILEFCYSEYQNSSNNYDAFIFIPENRIDSFMNLLKNKKITIYPNYLCNGFVEDNPYIFKIVKSDNLYKLSVEPIYHYNYLDINKKYLMKDEVLYRIPKEIKNLMFSLEKYRLDYLLFDKTQISKLVKIFHLYIGKSIIVDENIRDDFEVILPQVTLYFDIDDKIKCDIKFCYKDKIVDYKDDNISFLRNESFENSIFLELNNYGFTMIEEDLILDDINDYPSFIDEVLPLLSQKYTIFTSKKFDNINVINTINICANFSIGANNIFKYDFQLDGINGDEFKNIFLDMKENKKYYKLKNGNILKLNDTKLKQFKSLIEDIDLDIDDISDSKEYIIPKYKALYLDSLKNKNDKIIKTNNLFDEFVSNFKKVKKVHIEDDVLRGYQIFGVNWLYTIYKYGFGAILADEMGLGKSIQIIYFIKQLIKENKNLKALIVVPTSLLYNWDNEFKKFGNEIDYKIIAGNKVIRKSLCDNLNDINVLITTYGLFKEDREIYNKFNFELVVIDEAQNIKNPQADITKSLKGLQADMKVALTGTPIENSIIELWSIFDFIMPGYLNSLSCFQQKYNIKNIDNMDDDIFDKLNLQISPFILRRRKKDVLNDLPNKIENNIFLELNDEQKKIYITQLDKTKKEMDEIIQKEGFLKARFKILSLITKLRQICIDPRMVFDDYIYGSTKIDEVCNTIVSSVMENHKILLFTSFKKALDIVKKNLEEKNIKCFVIDGSVSSKKRNELVSSFNNDDTNVFLIMLKAGGTGLNLASADIVIHLDLWWNPQAEMQATDRAHRIGQKNTVQVIKFICRGTIEEKILELQEKKKILSEKLIEGDNRQDNLISLLDEEEFRKLLSYSE